MIDRTIPYLSQKASKTRGFDTLAESNEQAIAPSVEFVCGTCGHPVEADDDGWIRPHHPNAVRWDVTAPPPDEVYSRGWLNPRHDIGCSCQSCTDHRDAVSPTYQDPSLNKDMRSPDQDRTNWVAHLKTGHYIVQHPDDTTDDHADDCQCYACRRAAHPTPPSE